MGEVIEQRVKRGAALLDELVADWAARVAPDRLAMESCDQCVLGQLFGDYHLGGKRLASCLPETFLLSAVQHGFTLPEEDQRFYDDGGRARVMARFRGLADLWRAEVRARTTEAPPCPTS